MDVLQELNARKNKTKLLGKRLTSGEATIYEEYEVGNISLLDIPKYERALAAYERLRPSKKQKCEGFTHWDTMYSILEESAKKKRHFWFWSN